MFFTQYIITESSGSSVDPLGFLRPSAAIADGIFRQFTVLSNAPAYHGFLCFAYTHLQNAGIQPGKNFSRKFRDIETLWGILNSKAGTGILNVTKYAHLLETRDALTLDVANAYRPLYERLNYGTLGHYASPSIFWKLLNEGGRSLTDLGAQLGVAWEHRRNIHFTDLVGMWMAGKSIDEICERFPDAPEHFSLSAEPDPTEKQVWKKIITEY